MKTLTLSQIYLAIGVVSVLLGIFVETWRELFLGVGLDQYAGGLTRREGPNVMILHNKGVPVATQRGDLRQWGGAGL